MSVCQQIIRRGAVLLSMLSGGALRAQIPVVDCVVQNTQTSELVAYFGYNSNANPPVTIPLGNSNAQMGGVLVGAIPTTFSSPMEHILFAVRFYAPTKVTWTLNTATATADSSMVSACQIPVGQQLTPAASQRRCWDTSANNTCDVAHDVDGDGYCTILDCIGPRGAQGSTGPPGNAGNQGAAGPAGTVPVFQVVTASPGTARATVSCATTQFLVTGGGTCDVPNLPGMGRVASSAASIAGNGWTVSCNTGQATAVAVCANKQ